MKRLIFIYWLLAALASDAHTCGLVMQERDASNNVLVIYTSGLGLRGGIGGLLARSDTNGTAYYHSDAGGNETAIMDGLEQVIGRYMYDAFGNVIRKTGSKAGINVFWASSQLHDEMLNMDSYLYRDILRKLGGRWSSVDPAGLLGGVNSYGFVGNNPVNGIDLLGLLEYVNAPLGIFPQGPVPYMQADTWWGQGFAGLYNILPVIDNLVVIPTVNAINTANNAVEDGLQWTTLKLTGDPQLAQNSRNLTLLMGMGEFGKPAKVLSAEMKCSSAVSGKTTVYSAVENGTTKYVGITDNLEARAAAQLRQKGITIQPIEGLEGLLRSDARSVEQALIEFYGLGKNGGTLLNKINSISPNNEIYQQSMQRAIELLQQAKHPGF